MTVSNFDEGLRYKEVAFLCRQWWRKIINPLPRIHRRSRNYNFHAYVHTHFDICLLLRVFFEDVLIFAISLHVTKWTHTLIRPWCETCEKQSSLNKPSCVARHTLVMRFFRVVYRSLPGVLQSLVDQVPSKCFHWLIYHGISNGHFCFLSSRRGFKQIKKIQVAKRISCGLSYRPPSAEKGGTVTNLQLIFLFPIGRIFGGMVKILLYNVRCKPRILIGWEEFVI